MKKKPIGPKWLAPKQEIPATTTATDPRMAPAPITAAKIRQILQGLPPAMPPQEPLPVTPAQMEALQLLPAPGMPAGMMQSVAAMAALTGLAAIQVTLVPPDRMTATEVQMRQEEALAKLNRLLNPR